MCFEHKTNTYMYFKSWGFVWRPWDFGSAVIPLRIQTNSNRQIHQKIMDGEIWIKTVNIGDLWSRMKRSKTQCNIGAGKEII